MFALAVHECGDHVAKSREREVDFIGFVEAVPRGSSFALSLGPGQIHEIELASSDFLGIAVLIELCHFYINREDGVRAGRVFVHLGFSGVAVLGASLHDGVDFFDGAADGVGEIFHENALLWVFFERELAALPQQVVDAFVVYFQIRAAHEKTFVIGGGIDAAKNVAKGLGNDPTLSGVVLDARHRMRLATAGLSIGEYGAWLAKID